MAFDSFHTPCPAAFTMAPAHLAGKKALSDRVRRLWLAFESWLAQQQVHARKRRDDLLGDMDKKWRATPARFREQESEHDANRMKLLRDLDEELVLAARTEWDRRLDNAGLKAEDWIDITLEETLAVERALGWELDDENSPATHITSSSSTAPATTMLTPGQMSTATRSVNDSSSYAFVSPNMFHADDGEEDERSSFDESNFAFELVSTLHLWR